MAPLEIWDLPLDSGNLHDLLCADKAPSGAELFERVGSAASMLRARRWQRAADAEGFAALFICGGLAGRPEFKNASAGARLPFRVFVARRSRFFGVEAAASLIARHQVRCLHPLAVDAGQTAIKTLLCGSGDGPRAFPRDLDRLPVVLTENAGSLRKGVAEALSRDAVSFMAACVAAGAAGSGGPVDAIALGVPCELDAGLAPGGCTYPGLGERRALVLDVLEEAERIAPEYTFADEVRVIAANDAELCGYGALDELAEAGFRGKALVLSLGFGPGAAVVRI